MRRLVSVLLLATLSAGCSQTISPYTGLPANYDRRDQDSDGVINQRDRCANTELGAQIDNYGCSAYQRHDDGYELMVFFAHDSSQLGSEYYPQLQQVADFLARYPQVKISVEGYASASGQQQYNLALSQRRAQQVRQLLLDNYGIAAERVELQPFGEAQLLVEGGDAQAEAANRRVRIYVQQQYRTVVPKWSVYTPHLKQ